MPDPGLELFEQLMKFRPEGVSANAWAVKAGVSRTIWSDLRRHGNPSRRTLAKLLKAAGSSLAEFEALQVGETSGQTMPAPRLAENRPLWKEATPTPLPLIWTDAGDNEGNSDDGIERFAVDQERLLGRLPRPASLAADRNAFAICIPGEGMWPRFRPGRPVAVSPSATIIKGDDVLLILADGRSAMVAELVQQFPHQVKLRQFNPILEFEISAHDVGAMHKILGELI